jgi:hypothetical protein
MGAILRADRDDAEARKALSDAYVGAARQSAQKTRNADAAAFFRQAIEAAPQRRQELLPEYADKVAYSGDPARPAGAGLRAALEQPVPRSDLRMAEHRAGGSA